jgi:hypothetical protein
MNFKSHSFQVVAIALFVFVLAGCKKDDSDDSSSTNPPPASTASMTALVDNVAWASISNRAAAGIVNNTSNLTGVANDSTVITLTVTEEIELNGVYDLGVGSGNVGIFSPSTSGSAPAWSSNGNPACYGTLTVTVMDTVNKKISGTFEFKAWRATDNTFREVTSGVFTNVPYTTTISGTGNNTFSVKIDGVTFNPAVIAGVANMGNIMITASDNMGSKSVGLTIPETIAVGTYPIGGIGATYYGQYNPNSATFTVSVSGALTVTSHNTSTNTIAGTFSFDSEPITGPPPTYVLTNGSFTITY